MSLLFNTLPGFFFSFPAKKQWSSDFMTAVTVHNDFRAQEEEICHYYYSSFPPFICHIVMGPDAMILVFFNIVLSWLFHSPAPHSSRDSLVPLHILPLVWYHPDI